MVEQQMFQFADGGSIPTSPLQLTVSISTRNEIKDFIETWHYSKSINGVKSSYCFKMTNSFGEIVGAAIFGKLAMHNQYKRFVENESDVIELRRLCCSDTAPKNSESFMIGYCLRWLKRNTKLKCVVSYADAEHGHIGTIYKASNFEFVDFRPGAKVILWNGKTYHDKTLRTKYNGNLKPFAVRLANALESGEAQFHTTKGKYTYVYTFNRRNK